MKFFLKKINKYALKNKKKYLFMFNTRNDPIRKCFLFYVSHMKIIKNYLISNTSKIMTLQTKTR